MAQQMNMNQALVVLGEFALKNRLLEDQLESTEETLLAKTLEFETEKEKAEALASEKRILLADIAEQREEIENLKGGRET
jgi:hypothetical protein